MPLSNLAGGGGNRRGVERGLEADRRQLWDAAVFDVLPAAHYLPRDAGLADKVVARLRSRGGDVGTAS